MKILTVCLLAAFIFFIMLFARHGLKRLSGKYSGPNFINNFAIVATFIIWLAYIFWTIKYLFSEKFFYSGLVYGIIFVIIIFLSWYLLRDVFAGIIFRIRHNLRNGTYIKTGDFSGQVIIQELTCIRIKTGNNQVLRLPYSRVINEVLTELVHPGTTEGEIINVQIDRSIGGQNTAESYTRFAFLNTPWITQKEEPVIKLLKEDKDKYYFEISFIALNHEQLKNIRKTLQDVPSLSVE